MKIRIPSVGNRLKLKIVYEKELKTHIFIL